MLVMDAAGAGEDAFPLCPGAGDLVIRCCLLTDRSSVRSSSTLSKERQAGLPRTSTSLSHCTNLQWKHNKRKSVGSQILTCFCNHLCFCPFVVCQSHADRNLLPVWLSRVVTLVPLMQLAVFPRDSSGVELNRKKSHSKLVFSWVFKIMKIYCHSYYCLQSVYHPTAICFLTDKFQRYLVLEVH